MSLGPDHTVVADRTWPPCFAEAVIATQHGKEAVIAAELAEFKLRWIGPPATFDSDRFGTFTRDVPRAGTQLDAARAKTQAVLDLCPDTRIAIASEGAFGPDPAVPIVARGVEIVLLHDRRSGIELAGHDVTWETNFAQRSVSSTMEAEGFARAIGFPAHGLIVMTPDGTVPRVKDIDTVEELLDHVAVDVARAGHCWLETDMRAHRNPRRMMAIARAAQRLAEAMRQSCPKCYRPGFVAKREPGRPCAWCNCATNEIWREIRLCCGCQHREETLIERSRFADPGTCPNCNP